MRVYPRYLIYAQYNKQSGKCILCDENMNIHDLESENLLTDGLICFLCHESKNKISSNLDTKNSIMNVDLRDMNPFFKKTDIEKEVYLDGKNSFLNPKMEDYYTDLEVEVEEEWMIHPDEKIKTSWYHRAMLGDEKREIYDDGQDTDFELVEYMREQQFEREDDVDTSRFASHTSQY